MVELRQPDLSSGTPNGQGTRRFVSATLVFTFHAVALYLLLHARSGEPPSVARRSSSGGYIELAIFKSQTRAATESKTSVTPRAMPEIKRSPGSPKIPTPSQLQTAPSGTSEASLPASDEPAATLELPPGVQSNVASDYQRRLLAHIEPFKQYPADAARDHVQVVEVMFAMDRQGIVLSIWLKQSSGVPALDREAVATILRAQPLPPIPSQLPDPLDITVPIAFGSPS